LCAKKPAWAMRFEGRASIRFSRANPNKMTRPGGILFRKTLF
jgi:hypothetical protein